MGKFNSIIKYIVGSVLSVIIISLFFLYQNAGKVGSQIPYAYKQPQFISTIAPEYRRLSNELDADLNSLRISLANRGESPRNIESKVLDYLNANRTRISQINQVLVSELNKNGFSATAEKGPVMKGDPRSSEVPVVRIKSAPSQLGLAIQNINNDLGTVVQVSNFLTPADGVCLTGCALQINPAALLAMDIDEPLTFGVLRHEAYHGYFDLLDFSRTPNIFSGTFTGIGSMADKYPLGSWQELFNYSKDMQYAYELILRLYTEHLLLSRSPKSADRDAALANIEARIRTAVGEYDTASKSVRDVTNAAKIARIALKNSDVPPTVIPNPFGSQLGEVLSFGVRVGKGEYTFSLPASYGGDVRVAIQLQADLLAAWGDVNLQSDAIYFAETQDILKEVAFEMSMSRAHDRETFEGAEGNRNLLKLYETQLGVNDSLSLNISDISTKVTQAAETLHLSDRYGWEGVSRPDYKEGGTGSVVRAKIGEIAGSAENVEALAEAHGKIMAPHSSGIAIATGILDVTSNVAVGWVEFWDGIKTAPDQGQFTRDFFVNLGLGVLTGTAVTIFVGSILVAAGIPWLTAAVVTAGAVYGVNNLSWAVGGPTIGNTKAWLLRDVLGSTDDEVVAGAALETFGKGAFEGGLDCTASGANCSDFSYTDASGNQTSESDLYGWYSRLYKQGVDLTEAGKNGRVQTEAVEKAYRRWHQEVSMFKTENDRLNKVIKDKTFETTSDPNTPRPKGQTRSDSQRSAEATHKSNYHKNSNRNKVLDEMSDVVNNLIRERYSNSISGPTQPSTPLPPQSPSDPDPNPLSGGQRQTRTGIPGSFSLPTGAPSSPLTVVAPIIVKSSGGSGVSSAIVQEMLARTQQPSTQQAIANMVRQASDIIDRSRLSADIVGWQNGSPQISSNSYSLPVAFFNGRYVYPDGVPFSSSNSFTERLMSVGGINRMVFTRVSDGKQWVQGQFDFGSKKFPMIIQVESPTPGSTFKIVFNAPKEEKAPYSPSQYQGSITEGIGAPPSTIPDPVRGTASQPAPSQTYTYSF